MTRFEYCIWKKRFGGCVTELMHVILAHKWKKGTLGGGILCDEGVTIEISTGMGSRVILAQKSQSEKTICWHRL